MSYPDEDHGPYAQARGERQEWSASAHWLVDNDELPPSVYRIDPTHPGHPNHSLHLSQWNQDTNGAGFPEMEPTMDREVAHQAEAENWGYTLEDLSEFHIGAQEAYNPLPMSQPISSDGRYGELQTNTAFPTHGFMDARELPQSHDLALQDAEGPPNEPMFYKETWNEETMTVNWYRYFSEYLLALQSFDDGVQWHYNRANARANLPPTDDILRDNNVTREQYIQMASEPSNLDPEDYAAGFAPIPREPDGGWDLDNPKLTNDIRAKGLTNPPGLRRIQDSPAAATSQTGLYHVLASWATREEVDVRLLGATPITAVELLTFFPYHVRWSGFARRIVSRPDGFTQNHLGSFMVLVRNITAANIVKNHISFMTKNWSEENAKEQVYQNRSDTIEHTFMNWSPPKHRKKNRIIPIDYYVRDLAAGVPRANFPSGPDKGPLTYTIEHALDYKTYSGLKLSDVEAFSWARCFQWRCAYPFWMDNDSDKTTYRRHKDRIVAFEKTLSKTKSADTTAKAMPFAAN